MRILRRRSNLEVSSKGFALFVAGLVVATFLGGAVRTLLSSERVHQRIVRELKNRFPKNQIDIGRIEVLLSRGVWPGLSLRVRELTVGQDLCGKLSFVVHVPEAVLPINLLSFRTGRVRLGELDVPGGQVDLDFHACAKPGDQATPEMPSLRQTVQARGIRPPRLDWSDVADALAGVRLGDFEVNFRRTPQWKLKVRSARLAFGRDLSLTAALEVQRSLPFGTLAHPVSVGAVGRAGEIEWLVTSELKEGRVRWTGRWNLADNSASASAELTQVPLKELASELHQIGAVARDFKFKSAWLSCVARWSGPLATPFARPLELNGCHIEGAYGRAQLERAAYFVDRRAPFDPPAEIHVHRAQVQGLAEAAGVRPLTGVLAKPGVWTGTLVVSGPEDWTALGRLEDVEIAFSNQSIRGKQVINGVDVRLRRESGRLAANLDKFNLLEGTGEGRAELRYDWAARAGDFDVRLDDLSLSPAIQSLLVGGRVAPVHVNAAGTLNGDQLTAWDGEARSGLISGDGWRVDDLFVRAQFRREAAEVNVRATRVNVDTRWRHFDAFRAAFPGNTEDFAWRDLAARLNLRSDGGQLVSLVAPALTTKGDWRARGDWRRDGELFATLSAGPRPRAFKVRGERGALSVMPE